MTDADAEGSKQVLRRHRTQVVLRTLLIYPVIFVVIYHRFKRFHCKGEYYVRSWDTFYILTTFAALSLMLVAISLWKRFKIEKKIIKFLDEGGSLTWAVLDCASYCLYTTFGCIQTYFLMIHTEYENITDDPALTTLYAPLEEACAAPSAKSSLSVVYGLSTLFFVVSSSAGFLITSLILGKACKQRWVPVVKRHWERTREIVVDYFRSGEYCEIRTVNQTMQVLAVPAVAEVTQSITLRQPGIAPSVRQVSVHDHPPTYDTVMGHQPGRTDNSNGVTFPMNLNGIDENAFESPFFRRKR